MADPDLIMAGSSPFLAAAGASIQLYRYTSETTARANSGATLIDSGSGYTWALVGTTSPLTAEAGPYRYGIYDSGQSASSWYRYRFADSGLTTFSELSDPWEADSRPVWALRDILFEVGRLLGGTVQQGTATGGTTTTIVCPALWQSTARDAALYENRYVLISEDAAGSNQAPEGEERLIASVNTTTGTATVERAYTSAPAAGDTLLVSALLSFEEMIRVINRARERMVFTQSVDIALSRSENRYPAPYGVRAETDILDGYGVIQDGGTTSNREQVFPINYGVEFDGMQTWIDVEADQGSDLLRLKLLRSYRAYEGELTGMEDTTMCPVEWWRPVFAYEVAQYLMDSDPGEPMYQRLVAQLESEAKAASGVYAPEPVRRIRGARGRRLLPGPGMVR